MHCDPTASHYLKITLDGIFGHQNFRNEIVWKRCSSHALAEKGYDKVADCILFYSQSEEMKFNKMFGRDFDLEKRFPHIEEETGRRYQHCALENAPNKSSAGQPRKFIDRTIVSKIGWKWTQETLDARLAKNPYLIYWTKNGKPRYKIYADEYPGHVLGTIWTDVPYLSSGDKERLGYATQKPMALLERIIKASSNKGDLVLDPFCGCGTTIEAAHKLERRWIGIDVAIHAVKRVSAVRLEDHLGLLAGRDYVLDGIPKDLEGARQLWEQDPWQFQKWATEQVGGFVTSKRTADGGIDGRLWFAGERSRLEEMILEVKGGKPNIQFVRALAGVRQQRKAAMAGLILLQSPSPVQRRNFEREMAGAGSVEVLGASYARLQLLTVEEILAGKRFQTPGVAGKTAADPVLPMG